MNKFITQKIGALAGFSDEILKILASFDADVSDVRLALQISKNAPLADKILDLAFCGLSKFSAEGFARQNFAATYERCDLQGAKSIEYGLQDAVDEWQQNECASSEQKGADLVGQGDSLKFNHPNDANGVNCSGENFKFNPSQAASDTPPQNQRVAARADCALGSSISTQAAQTQQQEREQEQGQAQQQKQGQEWGRAQEQGREQGAATLKMLKLQRALELYGREQMRAFFLFAVFDEMLKPDLQAYRIDREKLTQVSLLRNLLMFSWIKSYPQIEQSILSSVILVEFGRVFIDEQVCAAGKAEEFYHAIKGSIFPQDFTDVEMEFSGTNRESVSHALFAHFGLEHIAQDALYSNAPDDAPFENKSRYAMLKIAKTAVNIYHHFDELSIDNALNLLVEFGFEQEAFLEAKGEISI
ncbi:MAG: hypothetical protein KH703_03460 [Campylobacter gracilis]|uniref:hypothetical protein n=1 Tax=Campylobacter gracilis TaxID=824 RepID=UPI0026EDDE22|nr:hypothetical protein [Campylobacter gracilis]MBS6152462.1 hypothetical protein [Campylobacter gracilis]